MACNQTSKNAPNYESNASFKVDDDDSVPQDPIINPIFSQPAVVPVTDIESEAESEAEITSIQNSIADHISNSVQQEFDSNLNLDWEFPSWCGGFAGFGIGTHSSRYSTDEGSTWTPVVGMQVPVEYKGVWDYLMSKYGSGYCMRPNIGYTQPNSEGYYRIQSQYLPLKSQCHYESISICNVTRGEGCNSYRQEKRYVCR